MAYPIPPAHRIEYDRDGSRIFVHPVNYTEEIIELTDGVWPQHFNDEAPDTVWSRHQTAYPHSDERRTQIMVILFPQPMTLTHWHANGLLHSLARGLVEWSSDTNDGLDGTWTAHGAAGTGMVNTLDPTAYRSPIALSPAPSNVKAVRFTFRVDSSGDRLRTLHLYGTPDGAENALTLWHPTEDRRPTSAEMDMGVIPQGGTGSLSFRVKNLSDSTASTDVNVFAEALTDTVYADLAEFSLDGEAWTKTVNVGNLAPGDVSSVVQARLPIGALATVGPKTFRIIAEGTDA